MRIIKFGGSVITAATAPGRFNEQNTRRLASELAPHARDCVLVHGTGHVGKPPALEHGYVQSGLLSRAQALTALRIKAELQRLNQLFVEVLLSSSVQAMSFDVAECFNEAMTGLRRPGLRRRLLTTLHNGIVPVFSGDLMPLTGGGFRVFSSERIVLILAEALRPETVFFLTSAPGVYGESTGPEVAEGEAEVLEVLHSANRHCVLKAASDQLDVSGGMGEKVDCALEISRWCDRCQIASGVNPGVLARLLNGERLGTRVTLEQPAG